MTNFSIAQKYEPLYGRPVRDIKASDIFLVATSGTVGAVGSTLAFDTITSSQEIYITNFYGWSAATLNIQIQKGTATILAFHVGADAKPVFYNTSRETPICKISGAATISIACVTGATADVWFSAVREPIFTKVETR